MCIYKAKILFDSNGVLNRIILFANFPRKAQTRYQPLSCVFISFQFIFGLGDALSLVASRAIAQRTRVGHIRDHLLFHTCDVTSRDQRNRSVNGGRSSERQIGHFQLRFLTQIDRLRYISWWYHNKGNICKVFPKNDVLRDSCPLTAVPL